jgi:hypothetical protein
MVLNKRILHLASNREDGLKAKLPEVAVRGTRTWPPTPSRILATGGYVAGAEVPSRLRNEGHPPSCARAGSETESVTLIRGGWQVCRE